MKPEDAVALGLFALAMGLVIYFSVRSSSTFKRRGNPPLVETREVGTGAEDASGHLSPLILYPPLTIALIVISVAISLMSNMGSSLPDLKTLLIADPESHGLLEIGAGEVWRLITPIFIHFGPIHLLFNMMWLWDLGKLIEVKKGHWFIAGFVLATGISSNLAQYLVTGSPLFGGCPVWYTDYWVISGSRGCVTRFRICSAQTDGDHDARLVHSLLDWYPRSYR